MFLKDTTLPLRKVSYSMDRRVYTITIFLKYSIMNSFPLLSVFVYATWKFISGTGKTLIARALANECSQGNKKMAFFMRKGADCLSKWVGESERQLRLLFEQAQQMKPSIIFFDEIDGLAPVRSTKQDQIHASIVSTLLALMDGLSDRGQVREMTIIEIIL